MKTTTKNPVIATKADSIALAGDIVIIDPCYIFPENLWSEFCDAYWAAKGSAQIEWNGTKMLVNGTAYGDGCYPVVYKGEDVGTAGVDAGLLCVLTLEDARKLAKVGNKIREIKRLGVIIKDYQGNGIIATEQGNFESDFLQVTTDGSDCDEDEDENWEE